MDLQPILPYKINTDLAADQLKDGQCRFIRNLTIGKSVNGMPNSVGGNEDILKPLQSNQLYFNVPMPEGDNFRIGAKGFSQTNEIYVMIWNSNKNHFIYRINCSSHTVDIIAQGSFLNFQYNPKYFIHECGMWLEVMYLTDPDTGEQVIKKDLYWTDGFNNQGFVRVDDSLATNTFNKNIYPYFTNLDLTNALKMGYPTPKDCITITEVPLTDADNGLNNNLVFNGWQFRIKRTNVFGVPSEHGIISDLYIPGINDCFSASNSLPRCVDLTFDAGDPFTDTIDVEYRYGNSDTWYKDTTLFLYSGSNVGKWWERSRNEKVNYNQQTNQITYRFCRDKECIVIDTAETSRTQNPLPFQSQALIKINKHIALFNNRTGFNPLPQNILEKFHFTVTPPQKTVIQTRNITIYAAIYNVGLNNYQQVSKDGTNGYIWGDNNDNHGGARQYLQYFTNIQQSGFLMYLDDGNSAISSQVYLNDNNELVDDPEFNGINLSPRHLTFQKWVFSNVSATVKIARLASHLFDTLTNGNYQQTSTTVWGICPFDKNSNFNISPSEREMSQELYIDVCDKDYNTLDDNKMLLIADLAYHVNSEDSNAASGYIWETRKNGFNERPMELMNIDVVSGQSSAITDHNGFFWTASRQNGRTFGFNFYNKCVKQQFRHGTNNTGMQLVNFYIDEVNDAAFSDYYDTACNRTLIQGRAILTGKNIGVPNASIILTRGASVTTDDNGNFTLIAHDDVGHNPRNDKLLVISGACNYTAPDGTCIQPKDITIIPCSLCETRTLPVSDFILQYQTIRSLLSGGTYGMRVKMYDWLGRCSYSQNLNYITIPSIIQSQAIGASTITATIDPDTILPDNVAYIVFSQTAETTISDYLTWIVDRVEFIDNTGNINTTAPTQIRIYYASVIEYSKQNGFSTTTAWQFIPNNQNTPQTGDKVQFFVNGDGSYFTKTIIGLVKYDLTGQYFLIDYTSDLQNLQQNALIRLFRPKLCTGNEPDFEICNSKIDVVNGIPQKFSVELDAFDTYYLSRQIPVPTPVSSAPSTQTVTTSTTVGDTTTQVQTVTTIPDTINELRNFGFRFEHHSPSNFWGSHIWNQGRQNIINPYESVIDNINQVMLSGAVSVNGQLNFLQYFDTTLAVNFDVNNTGGIYNAAFILGRLYVNTQFGHFVVGYNDNIARVNSSGQVEVPSGSNLFGNPEAIVGGNFGCQAMDKNSFQIRNDIIMFSDRFRGEHLQFNFSNVRSLTKNQHDAFTRKKMKSMIGTNRYFIGSIDPINNRYIVTDFDLDNHSYINSERDFVPEKNETLIFDIATGEFRETPSYTPEGYAFIDGDLLDVQLFSFKEGLPYNHSNLFGNTTFNTFYGIVCHRNITFVANINPEEEKYFQYIEFYCRLLYFAYLTETDNNQRSRVLISQWQRKVGFYRAAFLQDMNTPNVNKDVTNTLFNGNPLYGTYMTIYLEGQHKDDQVYHEINGITVGTAKIEKSGRLSVK